jgi:uncharacterized protein with HEPN domain
MLDAADEAVLFLANRTSEDLASERVLSLALMRCIEIIGEAASKLTSETRVQHPNIPWSDIVAMRNRLVHAYFDVDLDRVCDTIQDDLPPLITSLTQILAAQQSRHRQLGPDPGIQQTWSRASQKNLLN